MTEQFKIGEDLQKASKEGFETAVRAYGEANRGFQAIVAEVTNYNKRAFEGCDTRISAADQREVG